MFQTILRLFFLSNFFFLEKMLEILFMGRGLHLPAPLTRAAPLNPAYLWMEDSSRNRFVLNSISAKNPNIFFQQFFFLKSWAFPR